MPVTAHDVKFTLDLLTHPDVLELEPGAFSVTVLDDSTYTITYQRSIGGPINGTVFYPKHLLENLDPKAFRTWDFRTHPVGNGPYRIVRHVPMTITEYEASPTYYRGRPRIRRVVLKGLTGESALAELLSGHVQAIWLAPMDLPKLGGDPRFVVYYRTTPIHECGSFRRTCRSRSFSRVPVRRWPLDTSAGSAAPISPTRRCTWM